MNINPTKDDRPSIQERRLAVFLLALLVLIGVVMALVQARYDPAEWRLQAQPARESVTAPPEDRFAAVQEDAVSGLQALSSAEDYQAENLSDKINGKAELYLAAGFRHLQTQRFELAGKSGIWMERFIYDMGRLRGAFAVFSAQRRSPSEPLALTPYAYRASNGLFFAHGRYYVEIVASQVSPELQARMEALARSFVDAQPPDTRELEALARFPLEGRVPHSRALIADSAFGLEGLDWIFTAQYRNDLDQATAFLSKRSSAREAAQLADAFQRYWIDYGGEALEAPEVVPNVRMVTILDGYEIAMVHGAYLIGVHEASSRAFGLDLAVRLKRRMEESFP
jgi:hypothetical protein